MQGRYLPWLCPLHPLAQQIGKEMVIAVPLTPPVQRNDEQIGPLQPFQDGLTVVAYHILICFGFARNHCVAQWARQALEDRGLQ